MEKFDYDYMREFILKHDDAKIYLGVDSQVGKKKLVKFATVLVVHYNGNKGAKIFADVFTEKVVDAKLNRPFNRLAREIVLVTELYEKLDDVLFDRDFEIHVDVNTSPLEGSNVVHSFAKGMVMGVIGVEPIFKPDSFAASCCADKFTK